MRSISMLVLIILSATQSSAAVTIGADARVAENARGQYSRYVNFRPADGETVSMNPPRMSWLYEPTWLTEPANALHEFTLQIARDESFADPVVDETTHLNFLNTLPALERGRAYVWRVGYDAGTSDERWSETRSFTITPDAVEWDRSHLASPTLKPHPRILFSADSLDAIRALRETNPASRAAWEHLAAQADLVLKEPWWRSFPETDTADEPKEPFYAIAHDLALVAFVWRIGGDDKYAGVLDRAVTLASYPKAGRSSPEGLGGDGSEDATQCNEYLALLFDWLYQDLTDAQREVMIESLAWRAEYWMNSYAWRSKGRGGAMIRLTWYRDEEHLGDTRFPLPPTHDWTESTRTVTPAEGATWVYAELFNYYQAGAVWWDGLSLDQGGGELVSDPSLEALGDESRWRFNQYNTSSEGPAGEGRNGTQAVGIVCDSSARRGAWGQKVNLADGGELDLATWYRTDGVAGALMVRPTSLSGMAASHQFEGTMDTAAIAVALYEHHEVGREWYDLMLNYLIGVTNNFGPDEAWNEGPGYGNSKMKWLMNATWYFETALPDAHLGRNPYYRAIGDFFSRVTPVGLPHSPWGNGAANQGYQRGGRVANFRKLAYLTGEGRFMTNWHESGGRDFAKFRPWIEYVLPYHADEPEPAVETDPVKRFDVGGWVTANSGPPSLRQTFEDGVGIIFQSRPRGGYSHSFNSDNSFQIHAYGQQINHGAGSSVNRDAYAYHTMSHTTILVDGLGQAQPPSGQAVPYYSRVIGFDRGESHVYFAGDSTAAYPHQPGRFSRWSLPLHSVYEERDCSHLERFVRHVLFIDNRYFVIFDDLVASRPTRFTWLYHILPAEPFSFDADAFTVRYAVDDVSVAVAHIANRGALELDDRRDLDAMSNPFTREDYREYRQEGPVASHNLWVTNAQPRERLHFLTVVAPYQGEEPAIERLDEFSVRVSGDTITFDPSVAEQHDADYVVDPAALY